MGEVHKTRAERRREEKAKRKLGEQLNKQFSKVSQAQVDAFFEERNKAEAMLQEGMKKFEDDCYARYQQQYLDTKAALQKELDQKCKANADHWRRYYDQRTKRTKAEFKRETIGDIMIMVFWILRDHFDFDGAGLHKFNLQMMRLEASMQEHEKLGCITIDDLVNQMRTEGYDIEDDMTLVNEMVDAEMTNFRRQEGPQKKGTVFNVWHEDEEERLKRLILEQHRDYPEIALVLGRTESACKSRARKLFGTQDISRILEMSGVKNEA